MSIQIPCLVLNQVFCLFDMSVATSAFFCLCLHEVSFSILTLLGCVSWCDSYRQHKDGSCFLSIQLLCLLIGEFSLFIFVGIIYRGGLTVAILLIAFWLFMLCTLFSCPLCDLMLFCNMPLTACITGLPV